MTHNATMNPYDIYSLYGEELPFGPGDYMDADDEEEDDDDYTGILKWVIPCERCRFKDTEACKWRKDEEPWGDDWCSAGELKTKE